MKIKKHLFCTQVLATLLCFVSLHCNEIKTQRNDNTGNEDDDTKTSTKTDDTPLLDRGIFPEQVLTQVYQGTMKAGEEKTITIGEGEEKEAEIYFSKDSTSKDITITLYRISQDVLSKNVVSSAFYFTPHNIQFDSPVTISIRLNDDVQPDNKQTLVSQIFYDSTEFSPLKDIQVKNKFVSGKTSHFSGYAVVYEKKEAVHDGGNFADDDDNIIESQDDTETLDDSENQNTTEDNDNTQKIPSDLYGSCTSNSDCMSSMDQNIEVVCVPETDTDGKFSGFWGGACLHLSCNNQPNYPTGCPQKSECLEVRDASQGNYTACYKNCNAAFDCRDGYECITTSYGSKVCSPGCKEDKDCTLPDLVCDKPTARCINKNTVTVKPGSVCTTSANCNAEVGICITEENNSGTITNVGGYCTQTCSIQNLLDPNSIDSCNQVNGTCIEASGVIGICYAQCNSTSECRINKQNADSSCLATAFGGVCSVGGACTSHQDCYDNGSDIGLRCVLDPAHPYYQSCVAPAYGTKDLTDTSTETVAKMFPTTKEKIDADTKKVGDSCAGNGQCGYRQFCYPEIYQGQATGFIGGYCTIFSCDNIEGAAAPFFNACSDDSICLAVNSQATACLKKCTATANCRTGYSCIQYSYTSSDSICFPDALLGP